MSAKPCAVSSRLPTCAASQSTAPAISSPARAAANSSYARRSDRSISPMMTQSCSTVLLRWNSLDAESATREILPCCGSRAWADGMAAQRPFASAQQLLAASDAMWANLDEPAWREAFAAHPRIGQQNALRSEEHTSELQSPCNLVCRLLL